MIVMNRRVHALVCACCLFCLTATTATAQSSNHHHPAAPPRRSHPKPARRVLPASQRLAPFVGVPCSALDDAALDPSCSDDSKAAPSQPVPTAPGSAAAQPSSIQPRPPSLLPPPRGSANGTLRLDVEPQSTQVFVDGFYAGSVGEINDRGLALGAGWHRLVFRSPGYETASANVTVEPSGTTTYHFAVVPSR
jgi:hypothetical protein